MILGFGILMYCRFTWQSRGVSEIASRTEQGGCLGYVLGSRCSMLDCHVLKGFGIYMIGMLDRLY